MNIAGYYWQHIDPTTKDSAFCDSGSPVRTVSSRTATSDGAPRGGHAALEETQAVQGGKPIVTE